MLTDKHGKCRTHANYHMRTKACRAALFTASTPSTAIIITAVTKKSRLSVSLNVINILIPPNNIILRGLSDYDNLHFFTFAPYYDKINVLALLSYTQSDGHINQKTATVKKCADTVGGRMIKQ